MNRLRPSNSTLSTCARCIGRVAAVQQPQSRSLATTSDDVTIFSGIQPTGVPHLGNYLGALKNWRDLQLKQPNSKLLFSIVDLHAITLYQKPEELKLWRRQAMAAVLATGLDPTRCSIFYQSAISEHAELMWILSCVSSMGYLARMTQWKSKLSLNDSTSPFDQRATKQLKLGLFAYPVLQAADILVHRATHVPVGEDQAQHLELSREIASVFNNQYGEVFPLPQTMLTSAKRVMSLKEPTLKMSKSHPDVNSRILLTDEDDVIAKKIKIALTDSIEGITYDQATRPGVSALVDLVFYLKDEAITREEIVTECQSNNPKLLKDLATVTVCDVLRPIRERYRHFENNGFQELEAIAEQGRAEAQASARATLREVRERVGLS